jgi:hypothetical protein
MKRDMDLVRAILIALEAHAHGFAPAEFTVAGYDDETIGHHIWLMAQGKLVTAQDVTSFENGSPTAIPRAITWDGHDFLATVRDERVWRRLKADLKDQAISLPFALFKELATEILKSYLKFP